MFRLLEEIEFKYQGSTACQLSVFYNTVFQGFCFGFLGNYMYASYYSSGGYAITHLCDFFAVVHQTRQSFENLIGLIATDQAGFWERLN